MTGRFSCLRLLYQFINKQTTMKKIFVRLSMGLFVVLIGMASCKKKSDPSTHDKFVGTWKMHQLTLDLNGNGSIDATDLTVVLDTSNIILVLGSNGSGTVSSNTSGSSALTWALANSDSYVTLTETGGTGVTHLQITTTPGSTFVVKDTSNSQTQWETFNKQ